jgi:hypothetical protein
MQQHSLNREAHPLSASAKGMHARSFTASENAIMSNHQHDMLSIVVIFNGSV